MYDKLFEHFCADLFCIYSYGDYYVHLVLLCSKSIKCLLNDQYASAQDR